MSLVYELGCINLYLYSYKFIWYELEKPSLLFYGYKTVDLEKQHQHVVRNISSINHYQFYRKDATTATAFVHQTMIMRICYWVVWCFVVFGFFLIKGN